MSVSDKRWPTYTVLLCSSEQQCPETVFHIFSQVLLATEPDGPMGAGDLFCTAASVLLHETTTSQGIIQINTAQAHIIICTSATTLAAYSHIVRHLLA